MWHWNAAMDEFLLSFDSWTQGAIGTPVPIEIFNESLVRVSEPIVEVSHKAQPIGVPAPGLYLVRAELPDGRRVSGTVEVKAGHKSDLVLKNEDPLPDRPLLASAKLSVSRRIGVSIFAR